MHHKLNLQFKSIKTCANIILLKKHVLDLYTTKWRNQCRRLHKGTNKQSKAYTSNSVSNLQVTTLLITASTVHPLPAQDDTTVLGNLITQILNHTKRIVKNVVVRHEEYGVARTNPGRTGPERPCYHLKSTELLINTNNTMKMLSWYGKALKAFKLQKSGCVVRERSLSHSFPPPL